MEIDKKSLHDHYDSLTDDALLEIFTQHELVDDAKDILRQELTRRGIPFHSRGEINLTTQKGIDRKVVKHKGSIILWRIFWRAVFPIIAIFALSYLNKFYGWITG